MVESGELEVDARGEVFFKVSGRLRDREAQVESPCALVTNCTQVKEGDLLPADIAIILWNLKNLECSECPPYRLLCWSVFSREMNQ